MFGVLLDPVLRLLEGLMDGPAHLLLILHLNA